MTAGVALLAAALLVLAVAVYVFGLAAKERREAARTIRAKEADFAIEREQHASDRATLIGQMAELANRPLIAPRQAREPTETPEEAAYRELGVVTAGEQMVG